MAETSLYFKKLQSTSEFSDVAERYQQKINVVGGLDPFSLKETNYSYNPNDFPPITNMNLTTYLVLTTSFYTKEQMKAYKSLNAFKYFQAGFVTRCGVVEVKSFYVILAKVRHSQCLNESLLQVWVISNASGSIETAHCTCMAGAGEVCSHVGAVLYAAEFIVNARNTTSCTDVRSLWNVPTPSTVHCEPIKSMTFGRVIGGAALTDDIPAVTADEIVKILQDIKDAGSSSVLMRVMEPFATDLET